jgi:hypothetical protein
VRRRDFIKVVTGSAVSWPLAGHGQLAVPVIGWLNSGTPRTFAKFLRAFQLGLREQGYVEGRNLAIKVPLGGGPF